MEINRFILLSGLGIILLITIVMCPGVFITKIGGTPAPAPIKYTGPDDDCKITVDYPDKTEILSCEEAISKLKEGYEDAKNSGNSAVAQDLQAQIERLQKLCEECQRDKTERGNR